MKVGDIVCIHMLKRSGKKKKKNKCSYWCLGGRACVWAKRGVIFFVTSKNAW